jgi:hypothetical protein
MRSLLPWLLAFALALTACGPKSMKQRMRDAERLADKLTVLLDDAEKSGNALEPDKMDRALEESKNVMLEKDLELYPEAGMLGDRLIELQKKAPAVRAERERIDLEKKMTAARERIVPKMTALREAMDSLLPDAPSEGQCDAVEKAAKAARDDIDDAKDLFAKNADFAAWAKSQRKKTDNAMEALKPARKKVKFLEGPVAAKIEGARLFKDSKKEKDTDARLKLAMDSAEKYIACQKEGEKLVADQELATASVVVQGKVTAPLSVVSGCKEELEGVKTELQRLKDLAAKQQKKKPPAETKTKTKKKK